MAVNWANALNIALVGLAETSEHASEIGSADHLTAATSALNAAADGASAVITDPAELTQAKASYSAAASIIKLIFAFKKH